MAESTSLTDPLFEMLQILHEMEEPSLGDYNDTCRWRRKLIDQLLQMDLVEWHDLQLSVTSLGLFVLQNDPRSAV